MGKQVKILPEETLDEQDALSVDPIELDEQPATVKKKESISPSSSVSQEPVEPSEKSSEKSTSINKYEAIGNALNQVAPVAKPLYDLGRRIVSGFADDLPKSISQGLEVAKSSVAPATVKEYIKTDAYVDFQKYVRKKENLKWYQPFDENKWIDQYADQFMTDTGRQEMAQQIAERNPEIIKRRQDVEKYAEQQKKEAEYKMRGSVQDFRDIHNLKDLGSYIGTMGGQAAYQIPLAILTRGSSSLLQESAEVYDQQIGSIARDKGISREEVVKQGLDEPAAGQAYALLAASLDAASAGNILKAFRVGARDGLLKRWVKTAVPEALTEPAQGVLEVMGGATGDKLEAGKEALTDPDRINEALGGIIGGSAGVFAASSPSQVVKEQTQQVDINNESEIDQKANVIQNTVEANESAVTAGQQDAPVIIPIQDDQETQAAPSAPNQKQEGVVSEDLQEEEITPQKSEEKSTVRQQIDALVESGDLSYTADNRVKIETEKGGQELQRIFEENKVPAKKVEEDTEPKTLPITEDEDTTGGSPAAEKTVQQTQEGVVETTSTPASQQTTRTESASGLPQLTSEELTFTRRVREPEEAGGIEGVKPHNQFKLNQGPYPRVHVLLSDKDADLYMEGTAAKRHPGRKGSREAIELAQKINRIAKEQRDKDNEVVLDFRQESLQEEPQQVEDGSNVQQPVSEPVGTGGIAEQPVGIVDSGDTNVDISVSGDMGGTTAGLPPPPPPPTKPAAKKEPARSERMRTTWARIKDDPNISPQVKEGISKEAKVYIPRSLRHVTEKEANAIIEANGLDESMDMYLSDATNEVHPDVDTAIGIQLFDQLQKADRFEDAAKVFEKLSIRGTELGQAVNAFKLMQGKTMAHLVNKSIRQARREYREKNEWRGQDAKKEIDNINQQAVEKVLKSEKIRKKISSEVKKGSIDKAINFLENLKVDTKGKAFDAIYGITAEAWNLVITAVQKGLKAGLTISQAINKAIATEKNPAFQRQEAAKHLDEQLKDYRVTLDPARSIREELKSLGETVDDIIRQHYSQQVSTKASLIEKLIADANVSEDQAAAIAKDLSEEFDILTNAAKQRALNRLLPKEKKTVTKKERKQVVDRLIEQSNLGALSVQTYNDTITDELGVPSLNDEQLKKIKELTDRIQEAKGENERSKAGQDLMNYIESLKGWTWLEAAQSVWYANILSGPTTWLVTNPFANLTNLVAELAIDIKNNPANAGFILRRTAAGLAKGLVQAGDVLKTGYNPLKGKDYKIESKPLLERIEFKGAELNPLNWLKYVTRAMKAGDVIFYQGLKEQRMAVMALKEDLKSLRDQIAKEDFSTAMEQAASEGFTGRDQKLRAYEIMESYRPEYAVQEAENFAAKGTFNYKPEGTLGQMANSLNTMRRDLPALNYIVPFVNTIINVANEYLNYHPIIGGIRAARGARGWTSKSYRRMSEEERARTALKAITGAIAMAAVFLADDPDDKDSLFEITANGTGDRRKNYELERDGWRPYSIRVGDTWYNYKNTPLAIPLATVGFLKDAQRYSKTPDLKQQISTVLMGSAKFFMDLNTLSGLADFLELLNVDNIAEYGYSFEKFFRDLEKTFKSFIIPNYLTQMSRLFQEMTQSPIKRADDIGDAVIRDVPWFRDHLDNLYDAFGDPVIPKQLEKFVPLNAHRSPADTEMFEFLQDNKLFVGIPAKSNLKPNGQPMTDEEYSKFAIQSGRYIKSRMLREYKMYARQNKEEIKQWFDDLKEQERRQAKIDLFGYF